MWTLGEALSTSSNSNGVAKRLTCNTSDLLNVHFALFQRKVFEMKNHLVLWDSSRILEVYLNFCRSPDATHLVQALSC
jgi:hypothetical protein